VCTDDEYDLSAASRDAGAEKRRDVPPSNTGHDDVSRPARVVDRRAHVEDDVINDFSI